MSCLPSEWTRLHALISILLACLEGHQEEKIVRELLAKDKVGRKVVGNVRNKVHCRFVHRVISSLCIHVPHLQYGNGAVHLAHVSGHVQLVKVLMEEFGVSPETRDNVSILTASDHELKL